MTDETTKKMREALKNSSDVTDSMGVCPVCITPPEILKPSVRQHDLEYVMHDAGLTKASRKEVDDNLAKNIRFDTGSAFFGCVVGIVVSSVGWIFW